jgi:hypothetical protein
MLTLLLLLMLLLLLPFSVLVFWNSGYEYQKE